MPHPRFKSENYENFGGINIKASAYVTGTRDVLSLYNYDFSVIGAWTKRPGSTQYIGQTFSTITGIHEFIRIDGFSQLMVGSSGGLWAGISTGLLQGLSLGELGITNWQRNMFVQPQVFNLGSTLLEVTTGGNIQTLNLPISFNANELDFLNFLNQSYIASGANIVRYNGSTLFLTSIPPVFSGVGYTSGQVQAGNIGATSAIGRSGAVGFRLNDSAYYYFYAQFINSNETTGPLFPIANFDLTSNGGSMHALIGSYPTFEVAAYVPPFYGLSAVNLYVAIQAGVSQGSANIPLKGISALGLDIRYLGTTALSVDTSTNTSRFIYALNESQINAGGYTALPVAGLVNYPYIYQGVQGFSPGVALGTGISQAINYGHTLSPRFLEIYNDRLAYVGFSGLPSSFVITEEGEPENILPDNIFEVRTNDGDILTGAKFYLNQLILFKQKSFHSFTGDAPENFYLKQLSNEYGCLNNKASCVWNDRLWFLDEKGICEFNGANIQIVSDRVEDKFQEMNLDAAKTQAIMLHHKERNEIWCGIPVNGATLNNLTIVYDYDANAWGYWDGFNPKYFANIKQRFSKTAGFYADYSGRINHFGTSLMGDNGAGISTVIQARFEHPMGQSVEKMFRRTFINYQSLTGETINSFNLNYRSNYGESIVLSQGITLTTFQNVVNYGISAKSMSLEIGHFSATERLRVYGYTLEYRYQRST